MIPQSIRTLPPAPIENVAIKPARRRAAILRFVAAARQSLLVSIFRLDDLEILRAFGEAAARGVAVEVLLTGRAKGWAARLASLAGCLECMGITVRRFPNHVPKYHAKYMVADSGAALISTMNLTRKCLYKSRDFLFETNDQSVVSATIALFRGDLAGDAAVTLCPRLIVGPAGARPRIEALLASARHSIRIMDHKLSDPSILALLNRARARGVTVEVQSACPTGKLVPHGRLIVIDEAIAVFGSLALSAKSLDERRELAVVIDRPDLVAKLVRQFRTRSLMSAAA